MASSTIFATSSGSRYEVTRRGSQAFLRGGAYSEWTPILDHFYDRGEGRLFFTTQDGALHRTSVVVGFAQV